MQFMLSFYDTAHNQTPPSEPVQAQAYVGAWMA